ncbi:MAG: HAD family hydrolase [Paludibacteraceae bacterium]|nr:HAD family hydrolase [Paludibacteraceae bacterium]
MYRLLFLDWDDTLGDWGTSALLAQRDIYEKHRFSEFFPSFEAYYKAYDEHNAWLWQQYGKGLITKDFLSRDFTLYPLVQAMGGGEMLMQSPALQRLADEVCEEFLALTNHYARLFPGTEEVMERLAKKFDLVLVSNGYTEVQYQKIEESGLKHYFLEIVLSEEAGVNKPDQRFFEIALERTNCKLQAQGKQPVTKQDILLIGDGYGSDIEGAKAFGIDQMWLCHQEKDWQDASRPATYKIRHLSEALTILGC